MMLVDGVEVLDVREAAHYVGRTPETVRRWVWSGRLVATRSANRLLVRRSDLDALTGRQDQPMTLGQWAALLPTVTAKTRRSAVDLIQEDRERRARR